MSALISMSSLSYLGIDSCSDLSKYAAQLPAAGVSFAIRWYAPAGAACTALTIAEAQTLSKAGVSIIAAWFIPEDSAAAYYTQQQGYADGLAACACAEALEQPQGSAIYFPVYFDPTPDQLSSVISPYYAGVQAALSPGGVTKYAIGVSGDAGVCNSFLPYADCSTWLAASPASGTGAATYTIIESSWQLSYPADNAGQLPPISCNVYTSSNILGDAFTIAEP